MNHLYIIALLFFNFISSLQTNNGFSDADFLLAAKADRIDDPYGSLGDWNPSISPCSWTGIDCDSVSKSIVSIDISGAGISGKFPSTFCKIKTLKRLNLGGNFFNGTLETYAISPCSRLKNLNLSRNLFVGGLPQLNPPFYDLQVLDFAQNNFSGEIPSSFGVLPSLRVLNLFGNLLSGKIPPYLGNLGNLEMFNLAYNPFQEGLLPAEIGNLKKMTTLWLPVSSLVGEIPETIGNLENLINLDLSQNKLTGKIPSSIGRLKNIIQIELYENRLVGELPETLGNLTSLLYFDASENSLTGKIPESFANLQLRSLGLNDNFLEGKIPRTIASNPNLAILKLFNNSFSGTLPTDLGKNSDLEMFDVSTNKLSGELPRYLCSKNKLVSLITFKNTLSGNISSSYGSCRSLKFIRIFENKFSGEFPETIWGLPKLTSIEIYGNRFRGTIFPLISQAHSLTNILISRNYFSGGFPENICKLKQLVTVDVSYNNFSGDLPYCISQMKSLQNLELQRNFFSGKIPVGEWPSLTLLNLSKNAFSGEIPTQLANLPVLTYLDLSENFLSGNIPESLVDLKLTFLNLSHNNLSGRIPSGLSIEIFLSGLLGNPGLCSDSNISSFPPCSTTQKRLFFSRKILIALAVAAVVLAMFGQSLCKNKKGRRPKQLWRITSFHRREELDESELLKSMKVENFIGSGSSSLVYSGELRSGRRVAVKRFCGEMAARGFDAEVAALGRARHCNIVKLLFSCHSEEMKILVYEFLQNGSLEKVLHVGKGGSLLPWACRGRIIIGVARALAYLHHDCDPAIIHRDVKSSNILLDGEFSPRLGDFGLSKTIEKKSDRGASEVGTCHIAGSCGYIAPGLLI